MVAAIQENYANISTDTYKQIVKSSEDIYKNNSTNYTVIFIYFILGLCHIAEGLFAHIFDIYDTNELTSAHMGIHIVIGIMCIYFGFAVLMKQYTNSLFNNFILGATISLVPLLPFEIYGGILVISESLNNYIYIASAIPDTNNAFNDDSKTDLTVNYNNVLTNKNNLIFFIIPAIVILSIGTVSSNKTIRVTAYIATALIFTILTVFYFVIKYTNKNADINANINY